MDSDRHNAADQILKAIDYGNISESEIERRIDKLLDNELNVPIHTKVNLTKVNLCNSLLWQLYTHGRVAYESHMETSKKVVEKYYTKYKHKRRLVNGGLRIIVLSLLLFIMLTTFQSKQWFEKTSTEDGQQYSVEYHEVEGTAIAKAIDEHDSFDELSTNLADEVDRFLGFSYRFPSSIGASYYVSNYHVLIMPEFISIICEYRDEQFEDANITLQVELFTNEEEARIQYEQDIEGKEVMISNVIVYKYTNIGKTRYIWAKGNKIYKLSNNGSEAIVEQDIQNIIEWEE